MSALDLTSLTRLLLLETVDETLDCRECFVLAALPPNVKEAAAGMLGTAADDIGATAAAVAGGAAFKLL